MTILKLTGRVVAMIVGIVGSLLALLVTTITVVAYHLNQLFDTSGLLDTRRSHGFVGLLSFVVGIIGSLLALLFPSTAAVLLLIAGLAMVYVAGGWGVVPLVVLGLAALLAFLDRRRAARA